MSQRRVEPSPDPLSDWPLVKIVNQAMKPTGRYTATTIRTYRTACLRYERFRGSKQTACEITPRLIEKFSQWMSDNGATPGAVSRVVRSVITVIRFADPELLPYKVIRRTFADSDQTGTIEYVMKEEYFPANTRIASPKTENLYGLAIARLSKYLGRPATIDDLTDLIIGKWIRAMRDEGVAVATINGNVCKVKALWTWLAKRRIVDQFPTVGKLPVPRKVPSAWTQEQMQALLDATARMGRMIGGVPISLWFRAFILTAFDTGERTSALLGLRWEYFNPEDRTLLAHAEIRKGGRKPMLYTLKPSTLAALAAIRLPERDLIFPWTLHPGTFYLHYKRLLKKAGLPYERGKSGPQKIRRTFASHIEAAGGNATAALDHTARKVTVESYLDPRVIKSEPPNVLLFDLEATA